MIASDVLLLHICRFLIGGEKLCSVKSVKKKKRKKRSLATPPSLLLLLLLLLSPLRLRRAAWWEGGVDILFVPLVKERYGMNS